MNSVVYRERVFFWCLGMGLGLLLGLALAPSGRASVAPLTDRVVLQDEVSEIESEKAPDLELGREVDSLTRIEARYHEKLPSLTERKAKKVLNAHQVRAQVQIESRARLQKPSDRSDAIRRSQPAAEAPSTGAEHGWRTWRTGAKK